MLRVKEVLMFLEFPTELGSVRSVLQTSISSYKDMITFFQPGEMHPILKPEV